MAIDPLTGQETDVASPLTVEAPESPFAEAPLAPEVSDQGVALAAAPTQLGQDPASTFFENLMARQLRTATAPEGGGPLLGQDEAKQLTSYIESVEDYEFAESLLSRVPKVSDWVADTYIRMAFPNVKKDDVSFLRDFFASGAYDPTLPLSVIPSVVQPAVTYGLGAPSELLSTQPQPSAPIMVQPLPDLDGTVPADQLEFFEDVFGESIIKEGAKGAGYVSELVGDIKEGAQDLYDALNESAVIDVAKMGANIASAIISIDALVEDPNAMSTVSTAASVAKLGAASGLGQSWTAAASALNTVALVMVGGQLAQGLYEKSKGVDYARSEGIVGYKDGKFHTEWSRGADNASGAWADIQTYAATETLNKLVNEYGFKVNEEALNKLLRSDSPHLGKGYITSNMGYAYQGGRDASTDAVDLVYSAIRSGALIPTNNTPNELFNTVSKTGETLGKILSETKDIAAIRYRQKYKEESSYNGGGTGGLDLGDPRNNTHVQGIYFSSREAAIAAQKKYNLTYIPEGLDEKYWVRETLDGSFDLYSGAMGVMYVKQGVLFMETDKETKKTRVWAPTEEDRAKREEEKLQREREWQAEQDAKNAPKNAVPYTLDLTLPDFSTTVTQPATPAVPEEEPKTLAGGQTYSRNPFRRSSRPRIR
jgi:hypothetical protein